jgi:hypothetical protein
MPWLCRWLIFSLSVITGPFTSLNNLIMLDIINSSLSLADKTMSEF